jgi:hypothetical protein
LNRYTILLRATKREKINSLLGKLMPCEGFDGPCDRNGTYNRQNTNYAEEESNYAVLCPECQKMANERQGACVGV